MMINPFIPLINSYLPEPEASLLNGMLFGTTDGFTKSFYQALITTGTIHIVALSGTNISILISIVSKITYPLGRRISSLLSIVFIALFILFVGPSPTIIRAGIMGGLSLIALYSGRQSSALLSLFIAGLVMLVVKGDLIKDISFQLSFMATLGIIIFSRASNKEEGKIKKLFKDNLTTTLSAQVATLPIIIFTFARVSLVAPISNLLIGWTIFPITVLGIITCLLGIIYKPLGIIPAWFSYIFLHFLALVIKFTERIPFAQIILNQ